MISCCCEFPELAIAGRKCHSGYIIILLLELLLRLVYPFGMYKLAIFPEHFILCFQHNRLWYSGVHKLVSMKKDIIKNDNETENVLFSSMGVVIPM